jgi:adenylate cyclase
VPSRLSRVISFGTERYPEKVARRLRAVNIAAWCAAVVPLILGALRLTDPERWTFGLGTMAIAAGIAATPLLHRFGSLAAPIALVVLVFGHTFRLVNEIGTGEGAELTFLTATGVIVLLVGLENLRLAAVLAALGIGLMVTLQMTAPDTARLASQLPIPAANFAVNVIANAVILFAVVLYSVRQTARAEAATEREYERSESLLRNILPPKIAARLKDEEVIADRYDAASVLFADMAGFTVRAADTAPDELVAFLNDAFSKLDALVDAHGLEKIKTTGDAYMVVAGVPEPRADHAEAIADLALAMREALTGLADGKGRAVPVRIGIASGPLVAGVVGTRKFFYDVWGDAVNVASRMESTGEAGKIQVAPDTHALLRERFELEDRGLIEVRGKGPMRTWFLIGRKSA